MSVDLPAADSASGRFFVPHDLSAPVRGAEIGPLAGLSFATKDMYDVAGTRSGGGNPDWLAAQGPATRHAPIISKLLDAGGTLIGKTICEEFFFSITGANVHYGTPPNLRAPGRLPGGSSSGSAAAVAAGICDFSLGSDTGGSVRVPAAFCGLYGIRPTHGRIDMTGGMPMSNSLDTAGWFAATPGVFQAVGPILLDGRSVRAAIERVFIPDDALKAVDAGMAAFFHQSLTALTPELPAPERLSVAPEGLPTWSEVVRIVQAYDIWQVYGSFISERRPRIGPGISDRFAFAASVTKEAADAASRQFAAIRGHLRQLLTPGAILVLPTTPTIAPKLDSSQDELGAFRTRAMLMTCVAGLGGLPQVTIPFGTVDACPAGFSMIGWPGGDESLLDLAGQLARGCGSVRV